MSVRDRAVLAAALLLVALPLLWPAVPPLNDLPGHLGRYHIAANLGRSHALQRHWHHAWAPIGNLGVDLPVVAVAPFLGTEAATKLVVLAIPLLFVLGLFATARVRGRAMPPAIGFAACLAYGHAFQLGFVNYALSVALAFLALAAWIALARRPLLRTLLFVPIAWALWIAHSSGWGLFGIAAWGADLALRRERGATWAHAAAGATLSCVPLGVPVLAMVGSGAGEGAVLHWDWRAKAGWVAGIVRDRWRAWDVAAAVVLLSVAWTALRRPDWRFDPVIATPGALLLVAFLLMPRLAMGGAYVDMRLLAPALALVLLAVRVRDAGTARRLLWLGMAFLALRMGGTAIGYAELAGRHAQAAAAIEALPRGASVLVLVREPCTSDWSSDRMGHLGGLAIARADAFENGQWAIPGQQLVRPRRTDPAGLDRDPSQLVYPAGCPARTTVLPDALSRFDRASYDHVWLIDFGAVAVPSDLRLRFHNQYSTLYSVRR